MEKVMRISRPRVGLANVGTEEHKGGELQQQAFHLLKESGLNLWAMWKAGISRPTRRMSW